MTTRRHFLGTAAVAAGALSFAAGSYSRILGANDRVNVGFMGTHSRGKGLLKSYMKVGGINVTHICDVDSRVLKQSVADVKSADRPAPKAETDIRRVLEDQSLDAIVIAAPDHWHAPAAIMALEAGKNVYIEKPCGQNPREGELVVAAQKRYGKVVQMGNQQRSSNESKELIALIRDGVLGETYRAETWYGNDRTSIGNGKPVDVPDWLNWDLWQGPAQRRAYHDNYVHYNWHWFWHWGTGESVNNGTHELDVGRWMLEENFPEEVSTEGGRHFYQTDDWEMYDTLDVSFRFASGKTLTWSGQSCNRVSRFGRDRGTIVYGTKGFAIVDRSGYELFGLDGKLTKSNLLKEKTSSSDLVGAGSLTDLHIENFLDNVRGTASTQSSPIAEGHKSVLLCHLANIAYRTGRTVSCDPKNGHVAGADAKALWGRKYESGWDMVS